MSLQLSAGFASLPGPRPRNDDFCGMVTPQGAPLDEKGALFAVADGVSGEVGGREAAEYSVRGLLVDYYATPATWETAHALDRVLQAINRWLLSHAQAHSELAGMATTLSAIILRRRRYVIAHVGDSRVYRLADGRLEQLTTDHVWEKPEMRHVLRRAMGLDAHLAIDYCEGELTPGDVFLLVSDGVWEPLGPQAMGALLGRNGDLQQAAEALVGAALTKGGRDNASAVIVRVDALPEEALPDSLALGRKLPLPPRLKPGQRLDRFEILERLHESRATLLYKARSDGGQMVALKTLTPEAADDANACAGLLAEEWLVGRVVSNHLPQVVPCPQRSFLYYAMTYHEGATLQARLDAGWHFGVGDAAGVGVGLLQGLATLHQRNVIHRDVKPANLHMGADGRLRILDLGVALNPGGLHDCRDGAPGTPSFLAPEQFDGAAAGVRTDLYAAGVTLYHLLTRKYPYGEVEPFQHPRFREPVPPTRYRPDIPQWLENILLKAVARDPAQRFETAEEFLIALEQGEHRPLARPGREPLVIRTSAGVWRALAALSLLLNLILILLLLR